MKNAIRISLFGVGFEAIGLVVDVIHHLSIGIENPEGLLTYQHTIIFIGFLITTAGVIQTYRAYK